MQNRLTDTATSEKIDTVKIKQISKFLGPPVSIYK